jgi:hypothetical protein
MRKGTLKEKRMIADFVGFYDGGEGCTNSMVYSGREKIYKQSTGHFEDMLFSQSWDWLMPAWIKLRRCLRDILDNGATQTVVFLYDEIISAIGAGEIDYAYEKVVKGIEWWNENK